MLIFFAIPISLADIREYKIPNIYLKVLGIFCLPVLVTNGLGNISNLLSIFFALIFLLLLGVGMGDMKLLAIIAISLNSSLNPFGLEYFIFVLLFAAAYLLMITIYKRSIPSKIPLAPSIFLALPFI